MKKLLMMATFFVVALVTTFAFTSCGDDDNSNTPTQATDTSVLGKWKFDMTSQANYGTITFNIGGDCVIEDGDEKRTCMWKFENNEITVFELAMSNNVIGTKTLINPTLTF